MNARVSRSCKACTPCRTRKTKCDSQRPTCSLCRTHGRRCEYGEDRRQHHGASRHTVQMMRSKVASLEALIENLTGRMEVPRSPSTSLSVAGPNTNATHTVEGAEMHTIVRSEEGYSIHGPTSAFRDVPSPALSRTSRSTNSGITSVEAHSADDDAKRTRLEQWKLELFAKSARQLQRETWLISQGKVELDGVPPETAQHLLDLYFNHQYNTYLNMYRPAVMDSLSTGGPYANKLLLNGIYYTAALQSGRDDLMDRPGDTQTLGHRFFRRFEELLPSTIRTSSIASISALIIMGSSLLTRGYQTLGWLYCGMAYRIISDLGLDINASKVNTSSLLTKEPAYSQSATDAELQRRVFWGAYMNDRFNSLYFGRPPSITLMEGFEPDRDCLDLHDEEEMWTPCYNTRRPPVMHVCAPRYNVSNRNSMLKLADITSLIIENFYRPGLDYPSGESAWVQVQLVQGLLDEWAETLPEHLHYDPEKDAPIPPHRFYPHTTYHTLHILLYRPFLPEGHLRNTASSSLPQPEIKQRCVAAALRIYALAQAYRAAFTLTRAPYLFSYALFSAATVIPLLHWEDQIERLKVIRFFLDALKEQQCGANSGLKKPIMIIRGMFERAGLDFNTHNHSSSGEGSHVSEVRNENTLATLPSESASTFDANMEQWDSWGGQDYRELFQDFLLENSNVWPSLDDQDAGGQTEMLFGMFG
ncbi:fungal-specific transcription factor domain-containing protein [Lophiotrema nucula]|uniref:Fungal-specific transcription factor domain-containing protein n=1 Tax=Lophiotrema nucula TaxID=690887 RepID=A0A6A5YY69_9PLEO|nr:fungal-specific transcription factor domain-containing protein [Lophiotrema nucula]